MKNEFERMKNGTPIDKIDESAYNILSLPTD